MPGLSDFTTGFSAGSALSQTSGLWGGSSGLWNGSGAEATSLDVQAYQGVLYQNSNGTTPSSANNDPVGYWGDASPYARNLIQATAGARPLVQTAVPSVLFDGSNDVLSHAGAIADTIGSVILIFTTGATSFATRGTQALLSTSDDTALNKWFEVGITSQGQVYFEYNNSGTIQNVVGPTYLSNSTSYATLFVFNGLDYYAEIGTTEQNPLIITSVGTFGWFGSVSGANNITLGGTMTSAGLARPFDGSILQATVYPTDITT